MKWYKHDPDAWLAGVIELTLEERGAYQTIICLLYSRNGDVPDDDRFMARACECRPQTWQRIKKLLIAKGKIRVQTDGKLTANRVVNELQTARKLMVQKSVLNEKRNENKDRSKKTHLKTTDTTTTTSREKDVANATSKESRPNGRPRGHRLPPEWIPKESHFAEAYALGMTANEMHVMADDMRLWAKANENRGVARKASWDATFSGWMRRNTMRNANGKARKPDKPTIMEAVDNLFERINGPKPREADPPALRLVPDGRGK